MGRREPLTDGYPATIAGMDTATYGLADDGWCRRARVPCGCRGIGIRALTGGTGLPATGAAERGSADGAEGAEGLSFRQLKKKERKAIAFRSFLPVPPDLLPFFTAARVALSCGRAARICLGMQCASVS